MINGVLEAATVWWSWMWAGFWQFTLLFILVAILDRALARWAWPQLRLVLWSLVLFKLLVPPQLFVPVSVTDDLFYRGATPYLVQGVADSVAETVPGAGVLQSTVESATTVAVSRDGRNQRPVLAVWPAILMGIWLAGVALLAVVYCARLRRSRRQFLADGAGHATPDWVNQLVAAAARDMRIRRVPQVVVTDRIPCPAVFGLRHPLLLVPGETLDQTSRADLRNIFMHELAHLKRRDLHFQALGVIVQIVYWFNPLVYMVRSRIHDVRELACDATVASVLRDATRQYRETLLDAARRLTHRPILGLETAGLLERPANIVARLRALENGSWRQAWRHRVANYVCGGAMAVFILPMGTPKFVNECAERRAAKAAAPQAEADGQATEAEVPGDVLH